jgi:hypothetical protein
MTPLEEKLRRAIQAKASQVPPEAVPPLRLSAHRRRSSSLAHGGGERSGAPARRGWLAPAAAAAVVVALIAASVAVSRSLGGRQMPPVRQHEPVAISAADQAAAWVADQVSRSDVVSCDLAMCGALETRGFPTSSLLVLARDGPGAARSQALHSQVIVMTAAARADVGLPFAARYAPAVIASFGSGGARIDVRVVAADGAAAYRSALATDLDSRQMVTSELLANPSIAFSAAAGRRLRAWHVDARLLIIISYLTQLDRVSVVAFGDSGPGAGAAGPLRSAELAITTSSGRALAAAGLRRVIATLGQQQAPYRPTSAAVTRLPGGRPGLEVEFAAPSPLDMIDYSG